MNPVARDTIVALSSSPGLQRSAGASREKRDLPNAIIRLSGAQACAIASAVFQLRGSLNTGTLFQRIAGWRRIAGEVRWRANFLPAHAYVMRSPRSYTREDVVELHVPALPWLISDLLQRLLSEGARLAQAGEFTRRALENERISIGQAEAIGALVASRTADEARVHAARLKSTLHSERKHLRYEIEDLLSLVELGLDFSHEDVGVLKVEEIAERLESLRRRASEIGGAAGENSQNESALLTAGLPRILLLGPTNAGKSSLFNRLLGRPAAIVSASRHTTRDMIEAMIPFSDSSAAVLIDSAGFGHDLAAAHADAALLRQAAWNATLSAVQSADVILLMIDGSTSRSDDADLALIAEALLKAKPAALAVVWTKSDLPAAVDSAESGAVSALEKELQRQIPRFRVSALSGTGLNELRDYLAAQIAELGTRPRDAYLAAAAAARNAARSAAAALARASEGLAAGHGEDIVAVELREAIHAFWQAEGMLMRHDAVTEATLDRIFSKFCIGK